MGLQNFRPGGKIIGAAVMTVAATYGYFLIFAQLGFLKILSAASGPAAGAIKPVMTVMGLAGVAGSVMAAAGFSASRCRRVLTAGFVLSAAATGLAVVATTTAAFYLTALLVGLGVGLTTVTLAGMLRRAVGDDRLGLSIGLGTGLAYGLCNLPAIFGAAANIQAGIAFVAALAGLAGGLNLGERTAPDSPGGHDYTGPGTALWVVIFLTLVWVDSAAFYIIQHTPALKADTWGNDQQLPLIAAVHLLAALLAGWGLDRRMTGRTILTGAGLLLAACLMIKAGGGTQGTGSLLYAAGVSVYSTALVFYPARGGRPGLAALVYAVAGWGGSALGIGLAEGRHELPGAVILLGAAIIAAGLAGRHLLRPRESPA